MYPLSGLDSRIEGSPCLVLQPNLNASDSEAQQVTTGGFTWVSRKKGQKSQGKSISICPLRLDAIWRSSKQGKGILLKTSLTLFIVKAFTPVNSQQKWMYFEMLPSSFLVNSVIKINFNLSALDKSIETDIMQTFTIQINLTPVEVHVILINVCMIRISSHVN